jgi:hypothetical protein
MPAAGMAQLRSGGGSGCGWRPQTAGLRRRCSVEPLVLLLEVPEVCLGLHDCTLAAFCGQRIHVLQSVVELCSCLLWFLRRVVHDISTKIKKDTMEEVYEYAGGMLCTSRQQCRLIVEVVAGMGTSAGWTVWSDSLGNSFWASMECALSTLYVPSPAVSSSTSMLNVSVAHMHLDGAPHWFGGKMHRTREVRTCVLHNPGMIL